MTIEEQVKSIIIQKYKSVRAFTQAIGVPYSTIDSMLKKGIGGTGVQTVLKVCHALEIDPDSIETGNIRKVSPAAPSAADFPDEEKRLLFHFHSLNSEGRQKLLSYSDDLISSGKYAAESAEA